MWGGLSHAAQTSYHHGNCDSVLNVYMHSTHDYYIMYIVCMILFYQVIENL